MLHLKAIAAQCDGAHLHLTQGNNLGRLVKSLRKDYLLSLPSSKACLRPLQFLLDVRAMVETVVVIRNLFALLVLAAVPGSAPQL